MGNAPKNIYGRSFIDIFSIYTTFLAGNYMFKVNNKNTRTTSMVNGITLVSLPLTLNIFYTLF